MSRVSVTLPELHAGQRLILDDPARFKIVVNGRRWGKTMMAIIAQVAAAMSGRIAWWVAPVVKQYRYGWESACYLSNQIPGTNIRLADKIIEFPGGGHFAAHTAHDPDTLRSEGVDDLVIDEAAWVAPRAWFNTLYPAITDRQGSAMLISTPRGRNWFYNLYQSVAGDPDWARFQFPTAGHEYGNPFFPISELDGARRRLPDQEFRQEFLAEFVGDNAQVFRNLDACIYNDLPSPLWDDFYYCIGVDWAQVHDWTAIVVIRSDGVVVDIDRFNKVDWTIQRGRLFAICERWGWPYTLVETNSIGSPNLEELQKHVAGAFDGFLTTHKTKGPLIQDLALAFEKSEIMIPNDPVLLGELDSYEQVRTSAGSWKFSAPSGLHDDTVIALALAWRAISQRFVMWDPI